ncbi:MAG: four helix bundle protein [Bacteroidales bacterium]|nr:four helix bundle protein [Bacteroidales bacterium]
MREDNIIVDKSKAFALRIMKLHDYLVERKIFTLSEQVLKSGTSIGANVREATAAQSRNDFLAKMYIAFKEAVETEYWLELLYEGGKIETAAFESIVSDCRELIRILSSITKTTKSPRSDSSPGNS